MNEIEEHALELFGENTSSPDVFTNDTAGIAQVRDSINDAIEEISMLTGTTKRVYQVPLRTNQTFYRIQFKVDHFGWITDVWYPARKIRLEQTDLIKLNIFNPRWLLNTGNPEAYFPIGEDVIGVWPKPAGQGDFLEVTCVVIPERYTLDTDRIKLRDDFKWAAASYAVGEYYASRGDVKLAKKYHLDYLGRLGIQKTYPKSYEKIRQLQTYKAPWPRPTQT